jgi:hypothetical protein
MDSHREMGNMQSELAELNQANSAGDGSIIWVPIKFGIQFEQ